MLGAPRYLYSSTYSSGLMGVTNPQWDSIEQWSPVLFIVGGSGVVTHAALMGVEAFTALSTPPDVFVTAGHLVALVGLLGLYPGLVDRTPTLARVAVAVSAVPIAGWVVMTVGQLLVVAGTWPSLAGVLPEVFFVVLLGSSILTYGLFGTATLRSGVASRADGLLVLAPGGLLAVLLVDSVVTGLSALDGLVLGGALAVSMLALGVRLRSWPERTSRVSRGDLAVG